MLVPHLLKIYFGLGWPASVLHIVSSQRLKYIRGQQETDRSITFVNKVTERSTSEVIKETDRSISEVNKETDRNITYVNKVTDRSTVKP